MKVILTQDVKGQGKKDQVINVSDGYARNFLFPKKLAVPADSTALNDVKNKEAAKQHKIEVERQEAKDIAKKLESITVTFVYGDGKTDTVTVEYGKNAVSPEQVGKNPDAEFTYTFIGWDKDFSNITEDITVTARYEAKPIVTETTPDTETTPETDPGTTTVAPPETESDPDTDTDKESTSETEDGSESESKPQGGQPSDGPVDADYETVD